MQSPVTSGPFLGIDTRLPAEKLIEESGAYVRDAVNVDLSDAGTLSRRAGYTLQESMSRPHSLWSDDEVGYFACGVDLMRFDGTAASVPVGTVNAGAPVSFASTPRGVVWTDGTKLGLLKDSASDSVDLGVQAPNPEPFVYAGVGGALAAGQYRVAFASVHPTSGERSPVTVPRLLEVGEAGKLVVTLPVGAMDTWVYVARDGEVLYHEATARAGKTGCEVAQISTMGAAVPAHVEGRMPAGRWVRYHNGRLLVASGDTVYYSDPFDYARTRPASSFVRLDGEVVLIEPTDVGVYLATADTTYFAAGNDFAAATLSVVAPYGAIPGTAVSGANDKSLWWFSSRGQVKAGASGEVVLVNDKRIQFSPPETLGAAVLREGAGLRQVISALGGTDAATTRAAFWVKAEVIN